MIVLVLGAAYFTAVYLAEHTKLRLLAQHVLRCAKRIYGVPEFRYYGLDDGIEQLLFSSQRGLGPPIVHFDPPFLLSPFDGQRDWGHSCSPALTAAPTTTYSLEEKPIMRTYLAACRTP